MLCLKHLTSFCLVGSKKTQQQEFTSHLGATITKFWEWQCLIAAEDTISPKQPHTKTPERCPAAKEEGLGKEPAPHEPAAVAQKGGQEDGQRVPRKPCHHSREVVSHFGNCCSLGRDPPEDTSASKELMKCCKKFSGGMSYF